MEIISLTEKASRFAAQAGLILMAGCSPAGGDFVNTFPLRSVTSFTGQIEHGAAVGHADAAAILEPTGTRMHRDRGQTGLREYLGRSLKSAVLGRGQRDHGQALVAAPVAALTGQVIEWAGNPATSIGRGFDSAVKAAGLKDVSPRVSRRTCAVRMVEAGVPMPEIS